MFILAMPVGDLRPEDVILTHQGEQLIVENITVPYPGQLYAGTTLHFVGSGEIFVPADSKAKFMVIHRPRPVAVGDLEAFERVLDAVFEFDEERRSKNVTLVTNKHYLQRLTNAISTYWLGEKLEPTE